MLNGITIGLISTAVMLFAGLLITILINALLAPTKKTPQRVLSEIVQLMGLEKNDTFLDMGCGVGDIVLEAYRSAQCKCFGYDISPIMIILARTKRILHFPMSKDIVFEGEDIFKLDLKNFTKIYCFLDEKSMDALKKKFQKFISNGGVVYSYRYCVKDMKGEKKVKLSDNEYLYIYSDLNKK